MMAMTANAATLSLPLDNLNVGWGSSYDAATKTITFTGAWKGRGWGYSSPNFADYSAYDEVVIEFEPCAFKVKAQIEYADENGEKLSTMSVSDMTEVGSTQVIVKLDAELKSRVLQIYLQNAEAGTLVLTNAYLAGEGDIEKPQTKDLFPDFKSKGTVNDDGTLTIDATAKDWGWFAPWYGDMNASDYDYLILELAEAAAFNIQVSIQCPDVPDQKATLSAGDLILKMPLDPETKAHIKTIALQNAQKGTFIVKAIYLATQAYVDNMTTGISQVQTVNQKSVRQVRYNLAGQRVNTDYKGIVIENGRKFIQK